MTQTSTIPSPVKTREVLTHHMDSRWWNDFRFRDGDIIIATYAKSGTTWMQQIVSQLIFGGAEGIAVSKLSPWVDFRQLPAELRASIEEQTGRRFVKTHLPADALVMSPKARYIYVGRDGRDTAWSYFNHHQNHTDDYFEFLNTGLPVGYPKIERGTDDPLEFYRAWLAGNGYPIWPYWENIRSWWALRHEPNVLLMHFNDMKADLEGAVKRVAAFLDIAIDDAMLAKVTAHCTFDYMKAHAAEVTPRGGIAWKGGADSFIHKGTNGRWRDALTIEDIAFYEAKAISELGPDCAAWLARGGALA
jgi:aryl sulfotransferase